MKMLFVGIVYLMLRLQKLYCNCILKRYFQKENKDLLVKSNYKNNLYGNGNQLYLCSKKRKTRPGVQECQAQGQVFCP